MTGSGPEAGLDLWRKLLEANKQLLSDGFHGDLDAPCVVVISEPTLGLSMELNQNETIVWDCLANVCQAMSRQVDDFAIACHTLHYYEDAIHGLGLSARFISAVDVVREYVQTHALGQVALLGAKPVAMLDDWSPYRKLLSQVDLEVPSSVDGLHQLIYDIKVYGPDHPDVVARFSRMIAQLESETVLLACSELPLIQISSTNHRLVDVTELLAQALARRALTRVTA